MIWTPRNAGARVENERAKSRHGLLLTGPTFKQDRIVRKKSNEDHRKGPRLLLKEVYAKETILSTSPLLDLYTMTISVNLWV